MGTGRRIKSTANVGYFLPGSVLPVEGKGKKVDTGVMEVIKQQVLGMGIIMVVLVGIMGLRVWGWEQERKLITSGKLISWRFDLAEMIRETGFNCVVTHEGMRMLVSADMCSREKLLETQLGDRVQLTGEWQETEQYGGWVKAATIETKRIEFRWWSHWWWRRQIERLRQRLLMVYRWGLPEPEASLVAGIVIGEQSTLPDKLKQALRLTGTTHIVAASGFNVAVIVGIGLALMKRWSRTKRVIGGGLLIWVYVLLCGASPPMVRAGLMGLVMLLGTYLGREYWSGWALIIVGLSMVIWQPWLLTSVSFQLSIAATAGVIWGTRLSKSLQKIYKKSIWRQVIVALQEAWITTLAAMIMTAPVVLMTFGQMSWWGLIVNPLVLWLIPPLMYLGLGFGALGFVWLPLTEVLRWLVWPIAMLVVRMIEITSLLPVKPLDLSVNWWMAAGWWSMWLGWWGRKR
jgi:ComEC/Rec2-related protein